MEPRESGRSGRGMAWRRAVLSRLRARLGPDGIAVRLAFWDGDRFDLGPAPRITLTFASRAILGRLLRGNIDALGDAYVDGSLRVEGRLQDVLGVGIELAERARSVVWLGRALRPVGKLLFRRPMPPRSATIMTCPTISTLCGSTET